MKIILREQEEAIENGVGSTRYTAFLHIYKLHNRVVGMWQEKFVNVEGVKTHYLESGAGENLTLVHGGGPSSCAELNYGDVIDLLSRHFRVIAPDIIGFGYTPGRGPEDFEARNQGDFLIRFLEMAGVKRTHLVGNSHGGWLVVYTALKSPSLADRLVIVNSSSAAMPTPKGAVEFTVGGKLYPSIEYPTYEKVKEHLMHGYLYKNPHLITEHRIRRVLDVSLHNYEFAKARATAIASSIESKNRDQSIDGKHISEYLHQIKNPVLLTWGADDESVPIEVGIRLCRKLSDVEMHVFPNAKHHVMLDQRERWSEVVMQFLKSKRNNFAINIA